MQMGNESFLLTLHLHPHFLFPVFLSFSFSICQPWSVPAESLKNNHILLSINQMQDCQEQGVSHSSCSQCESKDQAIGKCMQLIALLKKKAKKYEDSKIKDSQSLSSNTVRTIAACDSDLRGKVVLLIVRQLERKQVFSAFSHIRKTGHVSRDCLHFSKVNIEKDPKDKLYQFQTSPSINDIRTSSDPSPAFSLVLDRHMEVLQKNRAKNSFEVMVQNKRLGERVRYLEQELQESLRRQDKEIAKKRQSLSGLVEELSEKNEMIEELKSNIKLLESKLGAKENGILQCMLEEDSEALRKVVFRLENINDKLNIDLEKTKKEKIMIDVENRQMKAEIEGLRGEIKQLKEENFELEHDRLNVDASRKEMEFISHKINAKIQKVRKAQKKWSATNRSHMKHSEMDNILQSKLTKKTSTECDSLALHQSASHFQQMEQKLEAVFIYLFHIDDITFKLGSPQLFDEEEKELLNAHRQKYFKLTHNDSFIAKRQEKDLDLDSSEAEFNPFGDSVINALNEDLIVRPRSELDDKKKLLQAQLQSNKLIQKISELKQRNLYVRNVIISLFKTLQLKSLKKQTQGILTMLSDYFEYSQTERNQIFQAKNKRLFGFI